MNSYKKIRVYVRVFNQSLSRGFLVKRANFPIIPLSINSQKRLDAKKTKPNIEARKKLLVVGTDTFNWLLIMCKYFY